MLSLNFTTTRKKFTKSQIVSAIKKQESGVATKEVCRELGVSEATFYNWKAKYGGMEVSDVGKMCDWEEENAELKKMFAEMSLEYRALKNLIEKKVMAPREKSESVSYLTTEEQLSNRKACKLMNISPTTCQYNSKPKDDG